MRLSCVYMPCVCLLTVCLVVPLEACSNDSHTRSTGESTTTTTVPSTGRLKRPRRQKPSRAATAVHADGHGATFAVPASIASDCSADVTPSLQAWIDRTADNGVISFPAKACYRIEGTLRLAHRRDLVIDGHGTTLRAMTAGTGNRLAVRGRAQLLISDSRNMVVRDLVVRGANPKAGATAGAYRPRFEAQHAFTLNSDDNVTLDHVQAYDVYGDFVYIGGAGTHSSHITVQSSTFDRSGRQGISVTNGEDVTITGNSIGDVGRSLFDLEPNTRAQEVKRIRIENNTTGAVRNFWLANKGSGVNIGDVTVVRNVARAPSGGGVFVFGPAFGKRGPFTFTGNRFQVSGEVNDESATGAFVFVNATDIKISGNHVSTAAAKQMPGVELRTSNNVAVTGNEFVGASAPVVADAASRNVRVSPGRVTIR